MVFQVPEDTEMFASPKEPLKRTPTDGRKLNRRNKAAPLGSNWLAGEAPSLLLTITLAAIYPKQTLESSVRFRDCAEKGRANFQPGEI
jgi:hypothetical protein